MGMKNRGKKVVSSLDETDTAVQLFCVAIEVSLSTAWLLQDKAGSHPARKLANLNRLKE